MMFCTKCGRKLEENEKFCPDCGTEIKNNLNMDTNLRIHENNNLIFESIGGNKTREIILMICGLLIIIAGLFLLWSLLGDKGGMSHSGYGGTWEYRSGPETEDYIIVIAALIFGTFTFNSGNVSRKSFLRLYGNHIEAKAFDALRGQSNVTLNYDQVQGVSIQKGMIVLESQGNRIKIFCADCDTAQKIILEKLKALHY